MNKSVFCAKLQSGAFDTAAQRCMAVATVKADSPSVANQCFMLEHSDLTPASLSVYRQCQHHTIEQPVLDRQNCANISITASATHQQVQITDCVYLNHCVLRLPGQNHTLLWHCNKDHPLLGRGYPADCQGTEDKARSFCQPALCTAEFPVAHS